MFCGRAKAARAARQAGASAKRRKMMADLETRERVWKSERSEEEAARAKLKAGSAVLVCSSFFLSGLAARVTAGLASSLCRSASHNLPRIHLQALSQASWFPQLCFECASPFLNPSASA